MPLCKVITYKFIIIQYFLSHLQILKERNKKLERELELEQEHLQRQHDHWEVQLKEEQLQKAAIEETVMIRTGHLESSVPGLEAGHEVELMLGFLVHSVIFYMHCT